MVTAASNEQLWNACSPMLVTESEMVTVASDVQPPNGSAGLDAAESGHGMQKG